MDAPSCSELERLEPASLPLSLDRVFERAFRRLGMKRPAPVFRASFYPFAGLRSSIRLRDNLATARVADVLETAPPVALDAVAEILVARLFRRTPSREARAVYLGHVCSPAVRKSIDAARRRRSRPRWRPQPGRTFDLEAIFTRLNRRYFQGRISVAGLGWSARASRTVLGHYDPGHAAITINRRLDSPRVPRIVLDYLVFHEMLHAEFPVEPNGHRRAIHSPKFREAEKKYPGYLRAIRWLKSHAFAGSR
jgi:SprT-like family protein